MIDINHSFTCLKCGHIVPPASQTCRNHCNQCLFSRHVDLEIPGDRASLCQNLMEPIRLDQNSKKGFIIIHQCLKCGKEIANKVADDDSSDALTKLSQKSNINQG